MENLLKSAEAEGTAGEGFRCDPLTVTADRPLLERSWIQRSLLFAELSRLAYGPSDYVSAVCADAGIEKCELIEDRGAEVYVLLATHDCFVVSRGTEPNRWEDLRADANAWTIALEIGRVHSGFHQHVDVIWPQVEELLRGNRKPVWFAGHSLGGAMATVCAVRCKQSLIHSDPRAIYSFGAPRVGDRRYVRYLKVRHYRWVNNNDIVTRMPPRWMGYRHMGKEIYLNRNGRISRIGSWYRAHDRWRGMLASLRKYQIDYLSDHSMTEYIRYIRSYYEDEQLGKSPPRLRHHGPE
jgi:triacylglycerol lipase